MWGRLSSWLEPVRAARTPAEREAIQRLRYAIYVQELRKDKTPGIDHARRLLCDPQDERSGSTLLYTGPADAPTGALRVDVYRPDQTPSAMAARYALNELPELADRTLAEVGRLVVRPEKRRGLVSLALARAAWRLGTIDSGVDVGLTWCAPGLVPLYQKLGYRPYAAPLIDTRDGLRIPLINIASDAAYYRAQRSPLRDLARGVYGPKRPPVDVAPLADRLGVGAAPYWLSPETVRDEIRGAQAGEVSFPLIDELTEDELRQLCRWAMVSELRAGQLLVREGLRDRELFVLTDGAVEILRGETRIAVLGPGAVIGEVALVSEDGYRSACVRAATAGRALIFRRRFLDRLRDESPDLAVKLLLNLSRVLATRLTNASNPNPKEIAS